MLHDQKQLPIRLDYLIKLDDVWMSHNFEDLYLSRYAFNIGFVLNLVLFEDLDGHLLTGECMCPQSDLAKCSLTESLAYMA